MAGKARAEFDQRVEAAVNVVGRAIGDVDPEPALRPREEEGIGVVDPEPPSKDRRPA
jgi:hypothetical protein